MFPGRPAGHTFRQTRLRCAKCELCLSWKGFRLGQGPSGVQARSPDKAPWCSVARYARQGRTDPSPREKGKGHRKVATPGLSCLIFFRASHTTRAADASEDPQTKVKKCLFPSASRAGRRTPRMASAEKDQARGGHFLDAKSNSSGLDSPDTSRAKHETQQHRKQTDLSDLTSRLTTRVQSTDPL